MERRTKNLANNTSTSDTITKQQSERDKIKIYRILKRRRCFLVYKTRQSILFRRYYSENEFFTNEIPNIILFQNSENFHSTIFYCVHQCCQCTKCNKHEQTNSILTNQSIKALMTNDNKTNKLMN